MNKRFLMAAAVCALFAPALFSDMSGMSQGGGMGMPGQGMGGGGFQPSAGRQTGESTKEQKKAVAIPAPTDNVKEILDQGDKLGLSAQQVLSIQMISADSRQEITEKSKAVLDCQREFEKSLNQNQPDFAYIHTMLKELTEAQANLQAVAVNSYEKAYALLTDDQKAKLAFFKSVRKEEAEKAAAAAQDKDKGQKSPSPAGSHSMIEH